MFDGLINYIRKISTQARAKERARANVRGKDKLRVMARGPC